MPSSFTQELTKRNLDFPSFALLCTRAMGVCIMMRDDDLSAPIPQEFKPQNYHKKALAKAVVKLAKLRALKGDQQTAWGKRHRKKALASTRGYAVREDNDDTLKIYGDMLVQVEAWKPPTKDHEPLQRFMIDQLKQSMRFDNHADYWQGEVAKLEAKSDKEYFAEQLKKAKDDVVYHTKEWKEEVARVKSRNQWLKRLRESLKR